MAKHLQDQETQTNRKEQSANRNRSLGYWTRVGKSKFKFEILLTLTT